MFLDLSPLSKTESYILPVLNLHFNPFTAHIRQLIRRRFLTLRVQVQTRPDTISVSEMFETHDATKAQKGTSHSSDTRAAGASSEGAVRHGPCCRGQRSGVHVLTRSRYRHINGLFQDPVPVGQRAAANGVEAQQLPPLQWATGGQRETDRQTGRASDPHLH